MQDTLLHPHHRAHLVEKVLPGEMDRVFHKYMCMLQDYKVIDIEAARDESSLIDTPRYYMFVLGILALQLGHPLSSNHRQWMQDNLHECHLNADRLEQAKMAMKFDNAKGHLLDIGSVTLNERIVNLSNDKFASWQSNFTKANYQVTIPNATLEVELAISRMHMDNELAKSKGATAIQGVDISAPLSSYPNTSRLEKDAFELSRWVKLAVTQVDMAPQRGELARWMYYQDTKGQKTEGEQKENGWTKNQDRDREMRNVFRELLLSGRLAALG